MTRRPFARVHTLTTLTLIGVLAAALILTNHTAAQGPLPPLHPEETRSPDTAQQQAWNVELVGQIGGSTQAIAIQDDHAYVGAGPRLVVLDISKPLHPFAIAQTGLLPGLVVDVAVQGNYAYVAQRDSDGLSIVDVSEPSRPTSVGFYATSNWIRSVAIAGNTAYISDYDGGLRIVDVSDPTSPSQIGYYDAQWKAYEIAVRGTYAYVAYHGNGLGIIDISVPTTPTEIAFCSLVGYAQGVVLAGDHAYVATAPIWGNEEQDWIGGGLNIIDVSDPTDPYAVGFCGLPEFARRVAVAGTTAYVIEEPTPAHFYDDTSSWLRAVDVSDSTTPTEIGSCAIPGIAKDVAVLGNHAYIADEDGGTLCIIDVTDPTSPILAGAHNKLGYATGVAAAGTHAYVTDGKDGLCIIDVVEQTTPNEIGFYDTPGYARNIVVAGSRAYVADTERGLRIIDITDSTAPTEIGFYGSLMGPGGAKAHDVAVAGDRAYLACEGGFRTYGRGLYIIDVAEPISPTMIGISYAPLNPRGVTVLGDIAYVADQPVWDEWNQQWVGGGLVIINVSNPAAPYETCFYTTSGYPNDVAVVENHAYLADGGGLRIFDVSNPAAPVQVGLHNISAGGITVVGGYAYAVDGSGLHIVDVSDPTNPVEIGFYATQGHATGVAVSRAYVYVADRAGGLVILWFAPSISAPISATGGGLSSPIDGTSYVFPANTFTPTAVVTHTPYFPGHAPYPGTLTGIDHFFRVTAAYSDTGQPASLAPGQTYTLAVKYTDAEIVGGPAIEDTLALYWWDGNQWVKEETSVVDTANDVVTATPGRLALWAVLGETYRFYLPLAWQD